MSFANVVVGLPVEGPFDYSVPKDLEKRLKKGMRAGVSFNNKRMLGFVVGIAKKSKVEYTKPLLEIIDAEPLLSKGLLKLTKNIAEYYGCSWGEAIEAALPEAVRNSRVKLDIAGSVSLSKEGKKSNITLIHDSDKLGRWDIYLKEIQKTLARGKSVLFLNTSSNAALNAQEALVKHFNCPFVFMHRGMAVKKTIEDWLQVKNSQISIVLGVISAVFAPLANLGLIIVDEEHSQNYKNDQSPHYNGRDVALMRADIEKIDVILASSSPSLEMMRLVQQKKISYLLLERKKYPEVKIIDMRRQHAAFKKKDILISDSLRMYINEVLEKQGRALVFVNKKGFASSAYCKNCNSLLSCPRCNVILTYHFKENSLLCHYCQYRTDAPLVCPQCNSGYIRYSGLGIEKVESELHRLYPGVKITKIEGLRGEELNKSGIFISTQSGLKAETFNFDLVSVVSLDNILNRVDFRSAEKAFSLLISLLNLTDKALILQTNIPGHYCFEALVKRDFNFFYDKEFALRKQLDFAPFKHFILIKVRGKDNTKVQSKAIDIFAHLSKGISRVSGVALNVNPSEPAKLRDNFYWQVLVKSGNPKKVVKLIKSCLKDVSHSGVIITLDADPL